jgi:hypothetical protein
MDAEIPRAWERVVKLSFGPRLSEAARHVYVEVQGRCAHLRPHSNTELDVSAQHHAPLSGSSIVLHLFLGLGKA